MNEDSFVCGGVSYDDRYQDDTLPRIVVLVLLSDLPQPVEFIVDTGATWCVLDPLLIERLGHRAEFLFLSEHPLTIRGITYAGSFYRVSMSFEAMTGQGLELESTVFVPKLLPDETWLYPNFIGLDGFLNRIRFAVDPLFNMFYFGPLIEE